MQSDELVVYEAVCNALNYNDSVGFLESESQTLNFKQKLIMQEAKEKLKIDAVYFIQTAPNTLSIPVVYFKKLKTVDLEEIQELHKKVWNQGRAPVLFIITPTEIRIYDCFSPPPSKKTESFDETRLVKKIAAIVDIETIRQELGDYSREKLDVGGLWYANDKQFNAQNRADQHLLRNLRLLRRSLIQEGLNYKFVHNLIARSIFILYLEDRDALIDFFKNFENGKYRSFKDVLGDKACAYKLFKLIGKHFNGDMFPVSEDEEDNITCVQLSKLKNFLSGTDLVTGQTLLWPYSFDVIPIEFISSIYEEFFNYEDISPVKNTTHYTPLFLVDFLVDQVFPVNSDQLTILDPSCGSGIFLVASYRRLIASKMTRQKSKLPLEELKNILKNQIFGVDLNGEAIRVAAFSLYLTMLDYIEPKSLWQTNGVFPRLIGNNLFESNFITSEVLGQKRFGLIIGNTPWGSTLSNVEMAYCKSQGWIVGDRQIAQAFLWKALEFENSSSIICLIVTAKGILFNRNPENVRFRKQFIEKASIETIINFSSLRHDIFENAIGPAAAIICSGTNIANSNIVYVAPKPALETKKLGALVFDTLDIVQVPKELAINTDIIWKSAMWGTHRDLNLILHLKRTPALRKAILSYGWIKGQGFQIKGSCKKNIDWMIKLPLFSHRYLGKYSLPTDVLDYHHNLVQFHRAKDQRLYKAPLCLIKGCPTKGDIVSAFSSKDVCFNEQILSISGKKEHDYLLKILTCILNSSIARYFLFMTSSSWGVERDYILVDEYLDLPFPFVKKETEIASRLVKLHDAMVQLASENGQNNEKWENLSLEIDEAVFNLFELSAAERQIVLDTVKYTIDYFQKQENSIACKTTNEPILTNYARNVQAIFNFLIGDANISLSSNIYTGSKNNVIISFQMHQSKKCADLTIIKQSEDLEKVLSTLYNLLKEQGSNRVQFKRVLKIYDGDMIYFIKPNENRYWTSMVSFNDADETVAEILCAWSGKKLA
jgi:hypothetical protein